MIRTSCCPWKARASQGKAGMKAFRSRSVASEVLRKTRKPVFLIPLHGREEEGGRT